MAEKQSSKDLVVQIVNEYSEDNVIILLILRWINGTRIFKKRLKIVKFKSISETL